MANCSFTDLVVVKDSPEARRMKWELDHFNPPAFKPRTCAKPITMEELEKNALEFYRNFSSKKNKSKRR